MREARTIQDVKDLFADHNVHPHCIEGKVYLLMPGVWEMDEHQKVQVAVRSQTVLESDPASVQFQRTAHNAILGLVMNPEFWRGTTVADQMTRFYGYDNGSMPAPFMRGQGWKPSTRWRMTGLTKKGGQPFTMHFESPEAAQAFMDAIK